MLFFSPLFLLLWLKKINANMTVSLKKPGIKLAMVEFAIKNKKNIVLNVKFFAIKVAKCIQISILTFIQNTKSPYLYYLPKSSRSEHHACL
jgi:hypothetical protein